MRNARLVSLLTLALVVAVWCCTPLAQAAQKYRRERFALSEREAGWTELLEKLANTKSFTVLELYINSTKSDAFLIAFDTIVLNVSHVVLSGSEGYDPVRRTAGSNPSKIRVQAGPDEDPDTYYDYGSVDTAFRITADGVHLQGFQFTATTRIDYSIIEVDPLKNGKNQKAWQKDPATYADAIVLADIALSDRPSFSGYGGALLTGTSAVVAMYRCTLEGNSVALGDSGGDVQVVDSSLRIEGCVFNGTGGISYDEASVNGGSVLASQSTLTAVDSVWMDCFAKQSGGAIYFQGQKDAIRNLTLRNVTFDRNEAGAGAGGALIASYADVNIQSCNATNNVASSDGGAFVLQNGLLAMSKCIGSKNQAARAGFLLATDCVKVTLTAVTLEHHWASDGDGGAILVQNSSLIMKDSDLSRNAAAKNGGGVASLFSSMVASNVSFKQHETYGSGGAMYVDSGSVTGAQLNYTSQPTSLYACIFDGNWAPTGGAISVLGGQLSLKFCTLSENTAFEGGALALADVTNFTMQSSTVTQNRAVAGGSMTSTRSSWAVADSTFEGNTAITLASMQDLLDGESTAEFGGSVITLPESQGGAVNSERDTGVSIEDTVFKLNKAGWELLNPDEDVWNLSSSGNGGALYLQNSFLKTLRNISFTANQAVESGGAVRLDLRKMRSSTNTTWDGTWDGCTFSNNTATTGGALSATLDGDLIILGCTFSQNNATQTGGALVAVAPAETTRPSISIVVSNSTISRNKAHRGGGISASGNMLRVAVASTRVEHNIAAPFAGLGGQGGGIAADKVAEFVARDNVFTENSANAGGAIHAALPNGKAVFDVDSSYFLRNIASEVKGGGEYDQQPTCTDAGSGGALCLTVAGDTDRATIRNSTFSGNVATSGGGVLLDSSCALNCTPVVFSGTMFSNNSAVGENAGAVYAPVSALVQYTCGNSTQNKRSMYGCVEWNGNTAKPAGSTSSSVARIVVHNGTAVMIQSQVDFALHVSISNFSGYDVLGLPLDTVNITGRLDATSASLTKDGLQKLAGQAPPFNMTLSLMAKVAPGSNVTLKLTSSYDGIAPAEVLLAVEGCFPGEQIADDVCMACPVKFYGFGYNQRDCMVCPVGVHACHNATLVPASGYWQSHPRSPMLIQCRSTEACTRNKTLEDMMYNISDAQHGQTEYNATAVAQYMDLMCAQGYKGPLCQGCSNGYGARIGRCRPCSAFGAQLAWFIAARVFDVLFICFLFWTTIKSVRLAKKRFLEQSSQKAWESTDALALAPHTTEPSSTTQAEIADAASDRLTVLVEQLLAFTQILAIIRSSEAQMFFPAWLSNTLSKLAVSPLSTMGWSSVDCLTAEYSEWVQTYLPTLLSLCIPAIFMITFLAVLMIIRLVRARKRRATNTTLQPSQLHSKDAPGHVPSNVDEYRAVASATPPYSIIGLLVLMQYFYPSVSLATLNLFACKELEPPCDGSKGEVCTAVGAYWSQQLEMSCSDPQHTMMMYAVGLPMTVLVVAAYPIGLAAWMWFLHHTKRMETAKYQVHMQPSL